MCVLDCIKNQLFRFVRENSRFESEVCIVPFYKFKRKFRTHFVRGFKLQLTRREIQWIREVMYYIYIHKLGQMGSHLNTHNTHTLNIFHSRRKFKTNHTNTHSRSNLVGIGGLDVNFFFVFKNYTEPRKFPRRASEHFNQLSKTVRSLRRCLFGLAGSVRFTRR